MWDSVADLAVVILSCCKLELQSYRNLLMIDLRLGMSPHSCGCLRNFGGKRLML